MTTATESSQDTVASPRNLPHDFLQTYRSQESGDEFLPQRPGEPGSFTLLEMIGKGGNGEIWEAVQESLQRPVAVKRLRRGMHEEAASDTASTRRRADFQREALITAALEHPNIIPVHELGFEDDGTPLLAMKLARGTPWNTMIEEDYPRLPPTEFLAKHLPILIQVTQAVAFAHSRGIIHRDIKPGQVMVGEYGEVLLMDWGLAMLFDENRASEQAAELARKRLLPTRSTASSPSGTVAYMAPEQTLTDASRLGPWTDVFLLGGTLYHLLTGTPPHNCHDVEKSFFKAALAEIETPQRRAGERSVPPDLAELAMHAMAPEAEDRIRSAQEFLEGLRNSMSGAHRRRESTELTEQARLLLQSNSKTYLHFSRVDTLLLRALLLWPENPRAKAMRQEFLIRYAECALEQKDLGLAEAQIDRMEDDAGRDLMVQHLTVAKRRELRRDRLQGVAMVVVPLLLVAVVAVGFRLQATQMNVQSHRETAELFERLTRLKSGEQELARDITWMLPLPTTLQREGDVALPQDVDWAKLQEQSRALLRERAALSILLDNRLDPMPFELMIAEGTYLLRKSPDREGVLKAYESFLVAATDRPRLPESHIALGIAAARAGYATSATLHLAAAEEVTRQAYGPQSPLLTHVARLRAESLELAGAQQGQNRTAYREALAILNPEWARLALQLAAGYRHLGEPEKALAYSTAALKMEPDLRQKHRRLADRVLLSAAHDYLLNGQPERSERLLRAALDERIVSPALSQQMSELLMRTLAEMDPAGQDIPGLLALVDRAFSLQEQLAQRLVPWIAEAMILVARNYEFQGNRRVAELRLKDALWLGERFLADEHPCVVRLREELARVQQDPIITQKPEAP